MFVYMSVYIYVYMYIYICIQDKEKENRDKGAKRLCKYVNVHVQVRVIHGVVRFVIVSVCVVVWVCEGTRSRTSLWRCTERKRRGRCIKERNHGWVEVQRDR